MTSKQLAQWCAWLADNRKAEDIVILDVAELSSVTDFFVIATGSSEPHLRAIRDEIADQLREEFGIRPRAVDGAHQDEWQVLDFFDVIVHLMKPEARERFDLEGLWRDGKKVKPRKPTPPKKAPARKAGAAD